MHQVRECPSPSLVKCNRDCDVSFSVTETLLNHHWCRAGGMQLFIAQFYFFIVVAQGMREWGGSVCGWRAMW